MSFVVAVCTGCNDIRAGTSSSLALRSEVFCCALKALGLLACKAEVGYERSRTLLPHGKSAVEAMVRLIGSCVRSCTGKMFGQ